jgi:hypothetical protein
MPGLEPGTLHYEGSGNLRMPGPASRRLLAPSVSPEGILGHGLHCEQGAYEESKEKQWLPVLRVRSSDSSAQTRVHRCLRVRTWVRTL